MEGGRLTYFCRPIEEMCIRDRLTLFVVPALYSLFHRKPMKKIELEDEGRADV